MTTTARIAQALNLSNPDVIAAYEAQVTVAREAGREFITLRHADRTAVLRIAA